MVVMEKNAATWAAESPRSLSTMVMGCWGRYHIPCEK
jgi:hypothetical protein